MSAAPRMPLSEAVRAHVAPGDHLHFASTPSRSNVALREVARQFVGKRPGFVLSTSGFHSTAHLLPLLRLGRRYVSCFFGDNWPVPRPNALYTRRVREGADLEHWSLLTYVEALRAGALGHDWAVTRSLAGTDLAAELARRGKFRTLPGGPGMAPVHQVKALRSDVTFVHAPFADENGDVFFSPPYGEGFWAALGARRGTIATVERIVAPEFAARHRNAVKVPASRLLAFCVEPFGAHPQPLYVARDFDEDGEADEHAGYVDDTDHYARWRAMATDENAWLRVVPELRPPDRYQAAVAPDRLRASRVRGRARIGCERSVAPPVQRAPQGERLVQMAAHAIASRVRARGHQAILAGIGNAFHAARLAKTQLRSEAEGLDPAVMVETGLFDVSCGPGCHGFLLSHDHIAAARRLSSVEDVLGALSCGADNRCLGVIGAAQVDGSGAVNSTRLADGTILVGSGGANDIASAAEEVVVVTTCDPARLVERVDHLTSPGRRVVAIATDRGILERDLRGDRGWRLTLVLVEDGGTSAAAVNAFARSCKWPIDVSGARPIAERDLLRPLAASPAAMRTA